MCHCNGLTLRVTGDSAVTASQKPSAGKGWRDSEEKPGQSHCLPNPSSASRSERLLETGLQELCSHCWSWLSSQEDAAGSVGCCEKQVRSR
uniref:Uncharacterized protein n=1 Tax=Equus caballus TaxID=9796 RepID=A0A3Q2I754_HORSE